MAPKRPLGLGKSQKKKQRVAEDTPEPQELTVELDGSVDPNDEFSQLKALWSTFTNSDKSNELVVNGVIHECDRLLRNSEKDLPVEFYSIYALALAEIPVFHHDELETVKGFFDAGLERVATGLEKYSSAPELLFAKSQIILSRIPLQYISQMSVASTKEQFPDIDSLLNEALDCFANAEKLVIKEGKWELFNKENVDILNLLDDLLDIIDNFGQENIDEGLDSDNEDEDLPEVELEVSHPLYCIKESDKYNLFWRRHTVTIQEKVSEHGKDGQLTRDLCTKLGQSYLMEAEGPANIYTALVYGEQEDQDELDGLSSKDAQRIAKELVVKAIECLMQAENPEEPQSWVDVAEAQITLGNLCEESEQEAEYSKAEERLKKANNATHGKYQDILDNLVNKEQSEL